MSVYHSKLNLMETEKALKDIKTIFERELSSALNLTRISAPLFVTRESGLNDNLNGVERPVSFDIKATGETAEVVHSLAKWKRFALAKYKFGPFFGLYTDMNAIRRDEDMDNLHSIYTDQWDWEKIIRREDRNIEFLKKTVTSEVEAICATLDDLKAMYPEITLELSRDVKFVTSQELYDMYPDKTPKERENLFLAENHTAFIMQIGGKLSSGERHDGRAPDYDDWTLNGDIMFWNELLGCAFEISSMGIRVDADAMRKQLKEAGCEDRAVLPFHKALLSGELPLTMGGGIGQSRLSMLLLQKAHIGEVQVSIWDDNTKNICAENGIVLL